MGKVCLIQEMVSWYVKNTHVDNIDNNNCCLLRSITHTHTMVGLQRAAFSKDTSRVN